MLTTDSSADGLPPFLGSVQSADGVFCVNFDQRIIYWSASAEEILGYKPKEVLGRPCYEVLGGRDHQNLRFCQPRCPIVVNARRGRPSADYDVLTRTRDGSDRWMNVSILTLRGDQRQPAVLMHLFRDVTERRRVEGLARRALNVLQELRPGTRDSDGEGGDSDPQAAPMPSLSRRELQVLQLLASGLSTREIASHLSLSPVTARNHITHLMAKLGAHSRLQAIIYASRRRLI